VSTPYKRQLVYKYVWLSQAFAFFSEPVILCKILPGPLMSANVHDFPGGITRKSLFLPVLSQDETRPVREFRIREISVNIIIPFCLLWLRADYAWCILESTGKY